MNAAEEIINQCDFAGIALEVNGERLRSVAEKDVVTNELQTKIRKHKAEIIRILQEDVYDRYLRYTFEILDERGYNIMNCSQDDRKLSFPCFSNKKCVSQK